MQDDKNINFEDYGYLFNNQHVIGYQNLEAYKHAVEKLTQLVKNDELIAFISSYFYDEINVMNINTEEELRSFYGDKLDLLRWFPAGLSIDMIFNIYIFFASTGKSEKEILKLLNEDIGKCIAIYNSLVREDLVRRYVESEEFRKLILNNLDFCEANKSKTESFNRMVKAIEDKNVELLRRLQ